MKERGILFSAPMVLALLAGRKSQTRRTVSEDGMDGRMPALESCPYGVPGDRLWVRETWRMPQRLDRENMTTLALQGTALSVDFRCLPVQYEAEGYRRNWPGDAAVGRYRNARFMPRVASRIALAIAAVRIERLSGLSEADAHAEGIELIREDRGSARAAYRRTWARLHGESSWDADPLVWVVEFAPVEPGEGPEPSARKSVGCDSELCSQ